MDDNKIFSEKRVIFSAIFPENYKFFPVKKIGASYAIFNYEKCSVKWYNLSTAFNLKKKKNSEKLTKTLQNRYKRCTMITF